MIQLFSDKVTSLDELKSIISLKQIAQDIEDRRASEIITIASIYTKKDQDIRAFLVNVLL